jgi:Pro-kumamolisin, activation domain/Kelch motif
MTGYFRQVSMRLLVAVALLVTLVTAGVSENALTMRPASASVVHGDVSTCLASSGGAAGRIIAGHIRAAAVRSGAAQSGHATPLHPLNSRKVLPITLNLYAGKQAALRARVATPLGINAAVSPGQFGKMFGAKQSGISSVRRFLHNARLTLVSILRSRTAILARGPVRRIDGALKVKLWLYGDSSSGMTFFAPRGPLPAFPRKLRNVIQSVGGLDDQPPVRRLTLSDPCLNGPQVAIPSHPVRVSSSTSLPALPVASFSLGAATAPCPGSTDSCVYGLGGYNETYGRGNDLPTVQAYDTRTNAWTSSDTGGSCSNAAVLVCMPTARMRLAATTAPCPGSTHSCIYALGDWCYAHGFSLEGCFEQRARGLRPRRSGIGCRD